MEPPWELYRRRARAHRAEAERMPFPEIKEALLRVARAYERLAEASENNNKPAAA